MRFFLVLMFLGNLAMAQVLNKDSVYIFKELIINSNRFNTFAIGNNQTHIDSLDLKNYNTQNLGDLLAFKSNIVIKNYGAGSLSTVSFRGTSSAQTAVLWNGFNLQGATLGLIDLSTLPLNFIDDVSIQHGGSGALFGSGAVGGSIQLDNKLQTSTGLKLSLYSRFSSFGGRQYGVNLNYGFKKLTTSLRFFKDAIENDFPFINTARFGNPKMKLEHGASKQLGVLQENFYRINQKQQINVRFWYQNYDRQIPPTMLSSSSEADLGGVVYRISSEWSRLSEKSSIYARTAFFDESLDYYDEVSKISGNTQFKTSISELETKINISKNQFLNVGLNQTYNQAQSIGFNSSSDKAEGYTIQSRNRSALFTSYKFSNWGNKFQGVISLRQELIERKLTPLMPSFGSGFHFNNYFSVKANVSRNYRVPTFNDLYWNPGGNPNLLPEVGWSKELGIHGNLALNNIGLKASLTAFNSKLNNCIIWLPAFSNWTPKNIQLVNSRGFESFFSANVELAKVKIITSLNHTWVVSTNEKLTAVNDKSVGKQLMYVPKQNVTVGIRLVYKTLGVYYDQAYMGMRYVNADNSDYLPAYMVSNLTIANDFQLVKTKLSLQFKINNFFNQTYQVMQWRPMPLRNYQLGLNLNF